MRAIGWDSGADTPQENSLIWCQWCLSYKRWEHRCICVPPSSELNQTKIIDDGEIVIKPPMPPPSIDVLQQRIRELEEKLKKYENGVDKKE